MHCKNRRTAQTIPFPETDLRSLYYYKLPCIIYFSSRLGGEGKSKWLSS